MDITPEVAQIHYEIAMSIGSSLDMAQMLKTALETFLRRLGGSTVGVHLLNMPTRDGERLGIAYTIPRTRRLEAAYQEAMLQIPDPKDLVQWNSFQRRLPIVAAYEEDCYYHILSLPKTGLLILVRPTGPLPDVEVQSLSSLLLKLASACQACLQTRELGEAHQNVMRANRDLAQKSQQLKDSQEMLYGTMADMNKAQNELRLLAAKNQATLDAIPDLLVYLNVDGTVQESTHTSDPKLAEIFSNLKPGDNIADVLPEDSTQTVLDRIQQAGSTDKIAIFELDLTNEKSASLMLEVRLVAAEGENVLAIFRDIGARKEAEEQIASLARFTAENPNPVLRIRQDGTVLYANDKSFPVLSAWQAERHGEIPDEWQKLIENVIENGRTVNVERTVGKRVYVFTVSPVPEANYVNLYGRDITERHDAEQALADERNLLRTLIDILPDRIFVKDRESNYLLNNEAHVRALGMKSEEQLLGMNDADFYPRELVERFRARELGVLNSGESVANLEEDFVDIDGLPHWFSTTMVPLLDVGGEIVGIVGMTRDITERKESEDALRRAATRNNLLAQAVDAASDGIVITDPGEEDNPMIYANPAFAHITGYAVEEVLGKNCRILQGEHTDETTLAELRAAIREQRAVRVTILNYRKDGQPFWNELKISPVFAQDGTLQHFVGTQTDITQRMELDKMRDDFVSTVSHELRTPLTSIMGWTETLLAGSPGPLTDLQKRFLQISYDSSQRLGKLIEEILTVSRVQRGTLRLQQRPFLPSQALAAVMTMITPIASARDINVEIHDEWPQQIEVMGDATRLEQVITNLLGNAIKFSMEGAQVGLTSRHIEGEWQVEVCDDGIGIPKDEVDKLFHRFYRASNANQAQVQGTGLGLYVCKAIIDGHGGEIGIESRENRGTKAWFSVPVQGMARSER